MDQIGPVIVAAEALGSIGPEVAQRLIVEEPMYKKFNYIYKEAGGDFAQDIYDNFHGGDMKYTFDKYMESYVLNNCGERITSITNMSKEVAKKIINKTIADNGTMGGGELGREIARELKKNGARIAQWRSRMIARTEVATASNVGQHAGALQTGQAMLKTWNHNSTSKDSRISHEHMDGTTIPIDQMFNVDGVMMQTPCDPSAPAEHTINCNCGLTYSVR